jgi:hypothetical protein
MKQKTARRATKGPAGVLRDLLLMRADLDAGGTHLSVKDMGALTFSVPAPHQLAINPRVFQDTGAVAQVRHGLELAWMRAAAPDRPALCGVLAARVAAIHRSIESNVGEGNLAIDPLLAPAPESGALADAWKGLAPHQQEYAPFSEADARAAAAIWPMAGPSEYLMATGADQRLAIDPGTGLNYYGCQPRPVADIAGFSSCTASPVSERGYVAAEASRRRIVTDALTTSQALELEYKRLRGELLRQLGIEEIADAILTPSGTDAVRLATRIVESKCGSAPLTAIVMGLPETGNGVPEAVAGRRTDSSRSISMRTIALRDPNGLPRAVTDIEGDTAAAIAQAAEDGHAVLHPIDMSKTGLSAPGHAFIAHMKSIYRDRLHVVIDCCQGRISTAQTRAYLRAGYTVVITGSKFYTGPPFSGAVLVPRGQADGFDATADVGTVLRWAAALSEMRAFLAVPDEEKADRLRRFGRNAHAHITRNSRLIPFLGPMPSSSHSDKWDAQRTILTFAVRDPRAPDRLLDLPTLSTIQRLLYTDLSGRVPGRVAGRICRLGQPVRLGPDNDSPIAALRLAAGARVVSGEPSHVLRRGESHLGREVADLQDVMAKIDLILDHFPALMCE